MCVWRCGGVGDDVNPKDNLDDKVKTCLKNFLLVL